MAQLAQETGDKLTLKRINAYENGDRMPGPLEAVILAKALGVRPAYIMSIDDIQTPITPQEEALIKNWRVLPENQRMHFFREIEHVSMAFRDAAVTDVAVERHIPPVREVPRQVAHKRRTKR